MSSDASLALRPAHPVSRYELAFDAVRPELDAIPTRQLVSVNLDIPAAVITVLGRLPALAQLRSELAELPAFRWAAFERLETYTQAVADAHIRFKSVTEPTEAPPVLAEKLAPIRALLLSDVTALIKRKLLPSSPLHHLRGATGFANIAWDVKLLAALLRQHWSAVHDRTGVRLEELDAADALAERLIFALGARQQGTLEKEAVVEARQRAFTLFVKAYDEVRRGVLYLRWHKKDADRFAPSLYAGRGGSGKKATRKAGRSAAASNPEKV